ncbi:S1/P1nuclease [Plasmodium ovale curtisi]|uniref:S1/P1nuclease n=2 Tax=Plasmodium ovale TaxID=36330 RepID=A0A1A8VST8_PLAOA|nr:S1/P1nuclease [Plasmodium ovale curtisi]
MSGGRKWHMHICLLLISLFLVSNRRGNILVNCFNKEGHEAIGMVAMSGMKNDQLYELKKILNGKDLVDIGKWGHLVHNKIKEAEPMHYNLQKNDCQKTDFTCEDKNGLCLLNSIKHFYNNIMSQSSQSSQPSQPTQLSQPSQPSQPTQPTQPTHPSQSEPSVPFKYPKNVQFTDSDSLKYLVSLISDMHQPLRIGYHYDDGGKKIIITHTTNEYGKVKSDLFSYLDYELIDKMIHKYESSWYSGWTHINRIFDEHKKDEILFKKNGINVIDIWAKEIINEFCSEFYLNHYVTKFMTSRKNELHFDITKEIDIPYDLEFQMERLLRINILRAGSRISIILNHIFENKKFSNFRKKSEFDRAEYNELEKYQTASVYRSNAIFINMAIICIVLMVIFYVNIVMSRRNKMYLPDKMEGVELQGKCNVDTSLCCHFLHISSFEAHRLCVFNVCTYEHKLPFVYTRCVTVVSYTIRAP